MRSYVDKVLLSATDLVNFLGCVHASSLDRNQLAAPSDLAPEDLMRAILQDYGHVHEQKYLQTFKAAGLSVTEIQTGQDLQVMAEQTTQAMQDGADIIYQGVLISPPWHGYADFLRKVTGTPSNFGNHSYEVIDTKLSSIAKPKHVFQLCIYSEMVAIQQGHLPEKMHLVLGDQSEVSLLVKDFIHYTRFAAARLGEFQGLAKRETTPEPCGHCLYCKWKERCEKEWETNDHLSLIARISKSQISRLREFGIDTMEAVASVTTEKVTGIRTPVLDRLRDQAALQAQKRRDGKNVVKLLAPVETKGFARMPETDPNDMFFDIEGFPLIQDGLEYLWGFDHLEDGQEKFTGFWAHDRAEEKKAFRDAVDLMITTIDRHPKAHIYHYASYEESALKRLSTFHGTREAEVDRLLRQNKLVDLYAVVREGIQVSEPAYSLKNLEVFFAPERKEEVKSGSESIIVYENWRKTGKPELLESIERYNEVDCRSTRLCRDWLLGLRPADTPWFKPDETEALKAVEKEEEAAEREAKSVAMQEALMRDVAPEDQEWHETVGYLLDFHRREDKSEWWKMFDRLEKSLEDQIEDPLCIGGLSVDPERAPTPVKQSFIHSLRFPPQDVKLGVGDKPLRTDTKKAVSEIVSLDSEAGVMSVKIGARQPPLPEMFSLVAPGPIMADTLRDAVWRYATAVSEGKSSRYGAITSIIAKEKPRLKGHLGSAIANQTTDLVAAVTDAVSVMDESHLLIQGPPGTGKTHTSAHAIVQLLKDGKRVGVTSNSHKAINNLLCKIQEVALERGVTFRGVKKSGSEEDGLNCSMIEEAAKNEQAEDPAYNLVGGTAWLFSRPAFDQQLDYIFVDEAGQVCLANVVAAGTAAKNIVLVGDQMQLSQPTQGIHPGNSGISALEYLLEDHATVPDDRGVLLNVTRRLHPSICSFISEAVYDGKLQPYKTNSERYLITNTKSEFPIAPFGLKFAAVEHEGCSQESSEEVAEIVATFNALLEHKLHCGKEPERPINMNDILVVSPYNMQVNALKRALPTGARVGTVDKFQGQEAAVVLISMTTSSGEEMPRNIEFLFSTQRLNVAISRAECLAVVFASPRLLEVSCSSIEQLRLVNTLCWARGYSEGATN